LVILLFIVANSKSCQASTSNPATDKHTALWKTTTNSYIKMLYLYMVDQWWSWA